LLCKQSAKANLELGSEHLCTALSALSAVALVAPEAFDGFSKDIIVQFVVKELLASVQVPEASVALVLLAVAGRSPARMLSRHVLV
jgi:hypothetical protein